MKGVMMVGGRDGEGLMMVRGWVVGVGGMR